MSGHRFAHLMEQPLPSATVASFLPMTFLENLDIDEDGSIAITSLLDGRIWIVPYRGQPSMLAQLPGRAVAVAGAPGGGRLVFGSDMNDMMCCFRIDARGRYERVADVPDGRFPNGVQRLANGHYLWADSLAATIWDVDPLAGTAGIWLRHPSLGPVEGSWLLALNGLKLFDGALYMTNSAQGTVLAVQVEDFSPAGDPAVLAEDLPADDFAIDRNGALYLTTHPMDTVIRLDPDGRRTRVAGAEQGVRGCTACRFGRRPGDETGLYVVTDGGLFNPASGGTQPSLLVRLETGIPGALLL